MQSRGVESGQQPGTGSGTDGLGGVGGCEACPLRRQAIEIRGVVIFASIAMQIIDPEVVTKNKNNIGESHLRLILKLKINVNR
jgi:hypothetical protein